MAKVPLTEKGAQTKQNELFSLAQTELDAHAIALATDFRTWIGENFELSADQQDYLNSADDDFLRLLSSVVFTGIRNRLPINFTVSPITLAAKRFETKARLDFDYEWGGSIEKSIDINLEIIYV